MKKRFFIYISLFLSAVVNAQTMTLDSCLNLARQNNTDIQTSKLDVVRAQEVKKQVFTKYFPQVQTSYNAYHAINPLIRFGLSDIQSEDMRTILEALYELVHSSGFDMQSEVKLGQYGMSLGVTAYQPIFAGGRIVNGNRLAKLGVEAAELQAEVSERDVLENIESSYYLVLGLQDKVQTVESALALLDSLDIVVDVAMKAGVVTKSDALRVALKRNEFLAKQSQLMSGIRLSKRLLCQQIGIEYSDSLIFQDESLTSDKEPESTATKQEAAERPEYRLLEINLQAEQYRKKLTIGEALPQVVFGGMYTVGNFIKTDFNQNALLFVTASVPITQWWETSHKIKEHNAKIEQARIKQSNLTGMMSIQEEKAYTDMMEAQAYLRSDSSALAMAQENYRLAELNYRAGVNTLSDVLEANALLLQAQNAITDRRITYITARRRYNDLVGKKE